jgi:hypothetical protein
MANKFSVGDSVRLPKPFSDVVGRVVAVRGSGAQALITVEYPVDEGSSEMLVKVFRPGRLTHVMPAVAV